MTGEQRKILKVAQEIDRRAAELAAGCINRERQEQLLREGMNLAAQLRAIRQEAWAETARLERLRATLGDQGVAAEDLQITLQG